MYIYICMYNQLRHLLVDFLAPDGTTRPQKGIKSLFPGLPHANEFWQAPARIKGLKEAI